MRAPKLTLARARTPTRTARRRFGSRRSATQPTVQGRWSLTSTIFRAAAGGFDAERRRTLAELLLERYGIVTREQVLAEGIPGGFSSLYDALSQLETLGVCRRGYFIEGLGGAQFALPGAIERLRSQGDGAPLVLAATDPAQPYGAALPWPRRDGETRKPARVGGAFVVLVEHEPAVYVERGGKGLLLLVEAGDARLRAALEALAGFVLSGRGPRLGVERVNGEPVLGSPFEELLVELGFRQGPRRLTLSA